MAILAQCAGTLSMLLFQNGFMLSYFSALQVAEVTILGLLSLPNLLHFLVMAPAAYYSDRLGVKRTGNLGQVLTVIGFLLIAGAGFRMGASARMVVAGGIVVFSLGYGVFSSGWYALLQPVVPEAIRGRFFGRLRVSWQTVAVLAGALIGVLLKWNPSRMMFQTIIGVVIALMLVRMVFYARIPELERSSRVAGGFASALGTVLRIPGYLAFCSYLFLLTLFTAGCPWIFSLLEKEALGFTSSQIVWVGNLLFIGSVAGFFAGGRMVDRWGTKPVFLVCHFSYALILVAFVLRGLIPGFMVVFIGALTVFYGAIMAASSIAVTTEIMALLPRERRSLAAAVGLSLCHAGTWLSGLLAAQVFKFRMLAESWSILGLSLTKYDSVLLGCGAMVLLLVVTLGLIPSMTGTRERRWVDA